MSGTWRAMRGADLDTLLDVAAVVHPGYPEERAVFAERLRLYPAGCRMAERDGAVVGYAVLHPGRLGEPPKLDSMLGRLPDGADCLYLHDVALLPAARGSGLGAAALEYAWGLAAREGFAWLALTSTPEARGYWDRQGFAAWAEQPAALETYGGGMTYMVRKVLPPPLTPPPLCRGGG
ncbi:MAG TPA: GNAT family N-acetyltransferase [Azospirillum sp.]|nr:GNAT family N-acetyltransferase [Azospirillum sp.]